MISRRFVFLAALVLLIAPRPAVSGIYSPNEPFCFEFDENGVAQPMQFANGFELAYKTLRNIATDTSKSVGGPSNPDRRAVEARVATRLQVGLDKLGAEELAGLSADLLRLSHPDRVLTMLQPLARDPRRGDFFVMAHLAKAHQNRGTELREAFEQQQLALRGIGFPTKFGRFTRAQLQWLKKVETEYAMPLLASRIDETDRSRPKQGDLTETPDPLFPPSPPRRNANPLKYVGDSGAYEMGSLAEVEKAKLPPDALAVMQQLVLWNPSDTRLYWQLGELYNALGEPETALKILDDCTFNMGYSNPNLLDHRRILRAKVEEIQRVRSDETAKQKAEAEAEQETQTREARQKQQRFWWIVSVIVAFGLFLAYLQFKEVIRRVWGGSGNK
jgi:hypothetical protein